MIIYSFRDITCQRILSDTWGYVYMHNLVNDYVKIIIKMQPKLNFMKHVLLILVFAIDGL